jgi:hypothetical protein
MMASVTIFVSIGAGVAWETLGYRIDEEFGLINQEFVPLNGQIYWSKFNN